MREWLKIKLYFATFILSWIAIYFKIVHSNGKITDSESENVFNSFLDPEDPAVLKFIKANHIFKPDLKRESKINKIRLKVPINIANALNQIMDIKNPGFFIECGANDGIFVSNTLDLEIIYNWTGLLIEASPQLFKMLRENNRNTVTSNICLSGKQPEQIEFLTHKDSYPNWRVGNGKINPGRKYDRLGGFNREDYISEGMVNCFPLYSILLAMEVKRVDFFSLDVEGHEYKILEAIPYNKIDIKVIFVEHAFAPEGKDAIQKLLRSNGYQIFYEDESDFIFIKK